VLVLKKKEERRDRDQLSTYVCMHVESLKSFKNSVLEYKKMHGFNIILL
jgi:hypothetical protein